MKSGLDYYEAQLVKACRDIHVFGPSDTVVSGIVKALSNLDNSEKHRLLLDDKKNPCAHESAVKYATGLADPIWEGEEANLARCYLELINEKWPLKTVG